VSALVQRDLEHGTEEWHSWRDRLCGASEAPVVIGQPAYYADMKTWEDLRVSKVGLADDPSEFAQRAFDHGHRKEEEVRDYLGLPPAAFFDRGDYSVSLDSWLEEEGHWWEIKSPVAKQGSKSRLMVAARKCERMLPKDALPPYLWWQLVHQRGVLQERGKLCSVVVWVNELDYTIVDIPVEELDPDWPPLKAEWERFREGGKQFVSPSAEWENLAPRWLAAKSLKEEAEAEFKDLRSQIIALGVGRAAGVQVSMVGKKGSVDFKRVARGLFDGTDEEFDAYAEDFRKPASEYPTVKEVADV